MHQDDPREFLTVREAARLCGFAVHTMNRWRCEGRGPRFRPIGRSIRYLRSELIAWMNGGTPPEKSR